MRLLDQIEEFSIYEPMSGCIFWIGDHDTNGYATIQIGGTRVAVHILCYVLYIGPVPVDEVGKSLLLHHLCETRGCRNEYHLKPMTRSQHSTFHGTHRSYLFKPDLSPEWNRLTPDQKRKQQRKRLKGMT